MEEFVKQYGSYIIAVACILIVIGVVIAINKTGVLDTMMQNLLQGFEKKATEAAGM